MAKKVAKKPAARTKPKASATRKKAGAPKAAKKKAKSAQTTKVRSKASTKTRPKKALASKAKKPRPRVKESGKSGSRTKVASVLAPRTPSRSRPAPTGRPSTAVEAKPVSERPVKSSTPVALVAAAAPSEPLFPIAPPSGQRGVDLATAIQKSRMFFAGHGLGALASAIPSAGDFPPEAGAAIEEAHTIGLDDVFVFPPVSMQKNSLDHLVHRLAATSSDRLPSEHQYGQPWLYKSETLKSFAVHGRPAGAYALCYYSGPFPGATGGLDATELREWLGQRQSTSLTAYEYLVLQRLRAEQHGDHRFDQNTKDPSCQWHWLLDMSEGEGNDAKFPMAGWNPKMRRIELGLCGPRDSGPGKGTHATRVVAALTPAVSSLPGGSDIAKDSM